MKNNISVVIPLYNKEMSIARAVSSVQNQTEQDYELIIVNDGSTDNSLLIVQSLLGDPRVKIIDQKNAGESAARNRGVLEAKTDLIAFLDADDEWYPEFLESIQELIAKFPDADVFGSAFFIQNNDGSVKLPLSFNLFKEYWQGIIPNYLETIISGIPFNSSSVVVRKKALESIEGFPIGVKHGADVDTWIRLSFVSKFAFTNKPLSIYHRDAENRACNLYGNSFEVYYPVKELKRKIQWGEVPESQKQSAIEYVSKQYLSLAQTLLFYGNTEKAKELIFSCGPTRKFIAKKYWLMFCSLIPPFVLNALIRFKHNIINPLLGKYTTKDNHLDNPSQ